MPTAIPVRNVYFLLCYAWNQLQEKGFVDVATTGTNELVDLLARVLLSGVTRLRRRGLERGYVSHETDIRGIRGRLKVLDTVMRFEDRHGRATCVFDELSIDTPQNRVVKSAMARLSSVQGLDEDLRQRLRRFVRDLADVSDCSLSAALLRTVHLHSNNRHYRFLVNVAELVMTCALVDEASGTYRFRDFTREGREMARLFEHFVRNFLREERRDLSVRSETVEWIASSEQDVTLSLLPAMRTDITVREPRRTIVIDTKFYEDTFQTYYDKSTIHSANLYQLVNYLRNMESGAGPDSAAEGMLLYPLTSEPVDVGYIIQGHKVRIRTVDLSRSWQEIQAEMLALV